MAGLPPPPPGLPPGHPAGGLGGAPPPAPITTFIERFRDIQFDTENDSYEHLLREFDLMAPTARTRHQLQAALLQEPDDSSWAMLAHWQDPNQPTEAGRVVILHGIK